MEGGVRGEDLGDGLGDGEHVGQGREVCVGEEGGVFGGEGGEEAVEYENEGGE